MLGPHMEKPGMPLQVAADKIALMRQVQADHYAQIESVVLTYIRPRPWYIPGWLWWRLARFVLAGEVIAGMPSIVDKQSDF